MLTNNSLRDIFLRRKEAVLGRTDKSRKGSVDRAIRRLIAIINSKDYYYTTSSCSGRIMVITRHPSGRKDKSRVLFVSHDIVNPASVLEALVSPPSEESWFIYEGLIIHLSAETIEYAEDILRKAHDAGLKHSGIISSNHLSSRFFVEIVNTDKIELPVAMEGRLLLPEDSLRLIVNIANEKLKRNLEIIKKLEEKLARD